MIIRGGLTFITIALLTLACGSEDEPPESGPPEREPAPPTPTGAAGDGTASPSAMGTSAGDCSSITGQGPLVALDGSPLQVPPAEVGSNDADAYRFRADFGYLQVTVRSDVGGRVRVFEQGAAGRELLAWNVEGMEPSTVTPGLPRGAYAISFEPFSNTTTSVDVSLSASAYLPPECETSTTAPDPLGSLGRERVVRGGYVGSVDQFDTYRLQLAEAATLSLSLTEPSGDVALRLFVDAETLVDGDSLTLLTASGTASRSIALPRGTYQLRVSPAILSPNNLYTLSASAVEYPVHDHPGDVDDRILEVQDLGTLGAAGMTLGGYLGALDPLDAFRIQLAEEAAIILGFADASGDPVVRLFRDAPAVDDDDALLSVFGGTETSELLSPGTYLIRVTPSLIGDAHSLYRVDLGLAR